MKLFLYRQTSGGHNDTITQQELMEKFENLSQESALSPQARDNISQLVAYYNSGAKKTSSTEMHIVPALNLITPKYLSFYTALKELVTEDINRHQPTKKHNGKEKNSATPTALTATYMQKAANILRRHNNPSIGLQQMLKDFPTQAPPALNNQHDMTLSISLLKTGGTTLKGFSTKTSRALWNLFKCCCCCVGENSKEAPAPPNKEQIPTQKMHATTDDHDPFSFFELGRY